MPYALAVGAAPADSPNALVALHIATALLNRAHPLYVFFRGAGVANASACLSPARQEPNLTDAWLALLDLFPDQLQLRVCSASAQRRGVLDAGNARRLGKPTTLAEGFAYAGLTEWFDVCTKSDRILEIHP
jgi:tRNA 2-thiouridine synthesizing protein D